MRVKVWPLWLILRLKSWLTELTLCFLRHRSQLKILLAVVVLWLRDWLTGLIPRFCLHFGRPRVELNRLVVLSNPGTHVLQRNRLMLRLKNRAEMLAGLKTRM